MITLIKVVIESIRQALQSLFGNKLRSFLSLLGITIGIFCIISIKSAVDTLQSNVISGFSELGSEVVYVEKFPWNEDPGNSFWKYMKRPEPSLSDLEVILDKSDYADMASYNVFTGGRTISYKSSSVSGAFIMGTSFDFQSIQNMEYEQGRYFNPSESNSGSNKVVLGYKVAEQLFNQFDPIGKQVKLFGQKFTVIGVLKEEGESMFNFINFDEVVWLPLTSARRFLNIGQKSNIGRSLVIKAKEGVDLEELKSELTGILRAHRRIRPKEDDSFSLMEMTALNDMMEGLFGALNLAGIVIGGFALVVGMFSVANIMFVSVKERTSIIGVKKALGAKNYIVLLEFLIESIVLCIIGGLAGILMTYGVFQAIAAIADFEMRLSFSNAVIGVVVSIIVGIISGIIPALLAARMDPVEAIRR